MVEPRAQNFLLLWLSAAVAIGTLASFGYSYVHDVELRFSTVEALLYKEAERITAIVGVVASRKERIVNNERQLLSIATDAASRHDSFTGSQGDALERRIDAAERNCDRIEVVNARLDSIERDMRETESYYRRQILPLFEQSNSLQQQRNNQGTN